MTEQHVSLVIPTIDEPDELRDCFAALAEQTHQHFSVTVVDSGTGVNQSVVDEWSDRLDVRMLSTPKNGLPRARNYAVSRLEDTDIVAFCDPDARPVDGWIAALVDEYEAGVGAVGGPVLEPGQSLRERETVGRIEPNGEVIANFDAERRQTVQHLRGTNMSFDADVLAEVGGFDPAYRGTAHFEDTDATYKIHAAGFEVVYTPSAAVTHHHPMAERDLQQYYSDRMNNWPILFEKTHPSTLDRFSFHARRAARLLYYSLETRSLIG